MFLLLREESNEIWKKKVDWIAENGGMVMLDVHPDYIGFGNSRSTYQNYPCAFYSDLLEYIAKKYAGQYWHALPRQVAELCKEGKPRRPMHARKRVCMIAFSAYESDNRVIRYAEALGSRGDTVDVVAVKRNPAQPELPLRVIDRETGEVRDLSDAAGGAS